MNEQGVVVISGTSSGLGAAMAERLATSGYHVIGIARREVAASDLGLADDQYRHFQADLSEISTVAGLSAEIIQAARDHGGVFGLINNAAIGTDGMLPTMHNTDIEQLLRVNVTSPMVLTKYLSRPMLVARRGRIINISSVVSRTGYRGLSVYAATKAAMEGFTRSLARDLGPRGVTVNCIAPGFADTAMTASLGENNLDRIRRRAALGRFPETYEIAAAAEYLLSPHASGVTGTTITVDAGNTA